MSTYTPIIKRYRESLKGRATRRSYRQRPGVKMQQSLRNKRKNRRQVLLVYKLTVEKYEEMLANQYFCCAICDGLPETQRALSVDHDHVTGKVRGLLCIRCNTALGRLEAVPLWNEKALEYLRNHKNA